MEVITQLLTVCLAVVVFLAAYRRRRSWHVMTTPAIVVVGDPDVTRRLIMGHADSFSNRPILPLGIDFDAGHPKTISITSAPHGPFWRALRRNLTINILHPSLLGPLHAPLQRDAVDTLVAGVSAAAREDGVVVVRDGLYAAVFTMVARLCFGDGDGSDRRVVAAMQRLLRDFFHSDVGVMLLLTSWRARLVHWGKWRELLGTRSRLTEVFGPIITAQRLSRARSSNGGGGISSYLDSLLDVRVPRNFDDQAGPAAGESIDARRALRDDEIGKLIWEFLGASTEAVVASVEWTLARLVTRPEVQEKLHRELTGDHRNGQVSDERLRDMPYLRAVILESLRLHPPQPLLIRDVGPDGAAAARGTGTAPPPPAGCTTVRFLFDAEQIGRNPKAWADPDEFRPERFLAGGEAEDVGPVPGPKGIRMVPFGAGRRHCPGAGLSMVQVGCFVAALVREFEWAPPVDGGGIDLAATTAVFMKVMASPLRARVTPRRTAQA